MAVMRQSLISIGYVAYLIPRFKDAAGVLDQRALHQSNEKEKLLKEISKLKSQLAPLTIEYDEDEIINLQAELEEKTAILREISVNTVNK